MKENEQDVVRGNLCSDREGTGHFDFYRWNILGMWNDGTPYKDEFEVERSILCRPNQTKNWSSLLRQRRVEEIQMKKTPRY